MRKSFVVLFALAIAIGIGATAAAQPAPGQFLAAYTITVNPGANAQFEEYMKKIKEGAEKVGAPQQWATFELAFGGPGNTYVIGLQFNEWGDLDSWERVPSILEQAYGAEEAAKILRSGGMSVASSETTVTRLLEDLSYNASSVALAPMYQIRISTVKRDMQGEYRNFLAKLNEAWEKAGDGRKVIRRVSVLGPSTVYTSAVPFQKWAERDAQGDVWGMIEKAHGELEMQQLWDDVQNSVAESEVFVIAHRPDLSRTPAAPTSNE